MKSTILSATVLIVLVAGWLMHPVNTPSKTGIFAIVIIALGFCASKLIKKFERQHKCTSCGQNLTKILNDFQVKQDIEHCPNCGAKIDI